MLGNNQPSRKAAGRQSQPVKPSVSCLIALLSLCFSVVAVAVFVFVYSVVYQEPSSSATCQKKHHQQCPGPRTTPSFLQIQVLGDGEHSARDVVVDPEKNPWVGDVISALQQIQVKGNDISSVSNVIVDPKENPWIYKLINALRNVGERQSGVPVVEVAPISNLVIDRDKNPWVDELIDTLKQIQAKDNDEGSSSNMASDPKQNLPIDKLVEALREAGKSHCAASDAGANSNGDGDDKSNAPVASVTAADRDDCSRHEANMVVDLKKPSWVDDLANTILRVAEFRAMDPAIRAEVKNHLNCPEGKRLTISDIIRFPGGEYSLDDAAMDRIGRFTCQLGGQATDWRLFGFASEEGGNEANRELSRQRACAVKEYLCKQHDDSLTGFDYGACAQGGAGSLQCKRSYEEGMDIQDSGRSPIVLLGEKHFINGVADSRSVVIAACRTES